MVVRPLVALMLAACLFAGCVAEPRESPAKSRDAQEGAVAALGGSQASGVQGSADAVAAGDEGAPPQQANPALFEVLPQVAATDVAPWYLAALDVQAGTTALGGFRWTVPEGSVQESKDYEGMSGVSLEMAFVVPDGATMEEYSVSWFVIEDETPTLAALQLGMPMEYTIKTTPLASSPNKAELPLAPTFLVFDERMVADGTELGIVISAKGDSPAFGVAWRVLPFFAAYSDAEPAKDSTTFLEAANTHGAGLSLQPRGLGTGFQTSVYLDFNIQAMVGIELVAGPVEVTDALPTSAARPTATVRDVQIRSSFDNPNPESGGWGFLLGAHLTAAGAAMWDVQGETHGTAVDASGTAASLVGYPLFGAVGQEEPSSDVTFSLTIAGADYIEILEFFSVDYGTAISSLLAGNAAREGFGIAELGAQAPTVVGRDLVLGQPGETRIHLLGAGDLVQ